MEQSEKVLAFLMVGGIMFASEGSLEFFIKEANRERLFFVGIDPQTAEKFLISVANVLSVKEVGRHEIIKGGMKLVVPGGRVH